jgi:uncharacterized surface protein with fasciclin (FAS1) repeats
MNAQTVQKRNRISLITMAIFAVSPLAALSIGERFAGEETQARAEAGDRNYEAPGPFAGSGYDLPQVVGAAADKTVLDLTRGAALFKDYREAVQQADFGQVLSGPGPLTVFVPTDAAFDRLPAEQRRQLFADPDRLVDMLSGLVVRGRLSATDLLQTDRVQTLSGRTVQINQGGETMSFGDAGIVKTNLVAGNGVMHVVDGLNL